MTVSREDLEAEGLYPSTVVRLEDGERWAELEPDELTLDIDRLTALGMGSIRVAFEPARCFDSGVIAETITLHWREASP